MNIQSIKKVLNKLELLSTEKKTLIDLAENLIEGNNNNLKINFSHDIKEEEKDSKVEFDEDGSIISGTARIPAGFILPSNFSWGATEKPSIGMEFNIGDKLYLQIISLMLNNIDIKISNIEKQLTKAVIKIR